MQKQGDTSDRINRAANWLDQIVGNVLLSLLPSFLSIGVALIITLFHQLAAHARTLGRDRDLRRHFVERRPAALRAPKAHAPRVESRLWRRARRARQHPRDQAGGDGKAGAQKDPPQFHRPRRAVLGGSEHDLRAASRLRKRCSSRSPSFPFLSFPSSLCGTARLRRAALWRSTDTRR